MQNKIHLAGTFRLIEGPTVTTGLLPGMLTEQAATGLQAHSTAGGFAEKIFANEDASQGRTTADQYVAGDPVNAYVEHSGSLTLALLKAGTHYTVGMKLISNGDGTLKATTGSPSQIIATVITDIDLSASGAVATLSPVRVM